VQHVVGGSANNLIVAMKDGIVIFDAPVGEGQSRWVIDAAKARYPGKPIKQLVMTHHHMDHSGGARTYVAEGAEVVLPGQARRFFERREIVEAHVGQLLIVSHFSPLLSPGKAPAQVLAGLLRSTTRFERSPRFIAEFLRGEAQPAGNRSHPFVAGVQQ
jgi:glyoxylase-like metal-dependent hydrolase (beta-lactamase superfamily II)